MAARAGVFGFVFAGDSGGTEITGGPEMSPITGLVASTECALNVQSAHARAGRAAAGTRVYRRFRARQGCAPSVRAARCDSPAEEVPNSRTRRNNRSGASGNTTKQAGTGVDQCHGGIAQRGQVENHTTNGRIRYERMGRPDGTAIGDDYKVAAFPSVGAGTDTRSSRLNSSSALSHSRIQIPTFTV